MCGRFSLISSEELIRRIFRLNRAPVQMRFNIAPTQDISVIRILSGNDEREWVTMRWGLVPSWAKNPSMGNRMINAKCETLFDKPAFRKAAQQRRCLIPADGFFEWKKEEKQKQPYFIYLRNREPFAFAGLWEIWTEDNQTILQSCTIITTSANELIQSIHERMPVILPIEHHQTWLDPDLQSPQDVMPMLCPYPAEDMALHPVGDYVNNARNNIPACIAVQKPKPQQPLLF